MRWVRIRLVLLGLLLCVVHVVSGTCGQTFTDPASSALLSDVVFEGKVRKTPKTEPGHIFNITVAIRKSILKGATIVNNGMAAKKVTIARFKNGGMDPRNCVGSVQEGRTYFFFLRNTADPKGLHFENLAMPVKKSKSVGSELRKILCYNCAQMPTISKLTGPNSLLTGTKATLTCAAESKPNPEFSWYKDGVLLPSSKKGRVRIKSSRRQSTLQIKRATQADAGMYQCVANNAVGEARKDFTVKARYYISPSLPLILTDMEDQVTYHRHGARCIPQTYCLNGGTCMFIQGLTNEYCVCPAPYTGTRCEKQAAELYEYGEVGMDDLQGKTLDQASMLYERTLITIGIVLAVLVFIIICIASYILAKNRRKQFEERRKRREVQRSDQNRTNVSVDRSNPQTRINKESESRSENLPSDFASKQMQQIMLQDSSLPPTHKPSHRNLNEPPEYQHAVVNNDAVRHQHESRQQMDASSVHETITDSKSPTFSADGDFHKNKSTAATLHLESIEMNVLQKTIEEHNKMDISKKDADFGSMNDNDYDVSVDLTLSLSQESGEVLSSPSHPHQAYCEITETSSNTLESTLTPSELQAPLCPLPLSSSQLIVLSQPFPNDASSRDENDTADQPLLPNHKKHFPTGRPYESRSDRDLSRYLLLGSKRQSTQDSLRSDTFCQESNHLPHSNTFPKSKVNGLDLDMYSESDDDDEIDIPYQQQLPVSEEELGLSGETLDKGSYLINSTAIHAGHEELVLGLLPNLGVTRPGMRKYQSEEGPAYSKLINKSLAILQSTTRSRSLDDPTEVREDIHDPMRLNSTLAGSPDVETYDNMARMPVQNSMYSYDPNDDSEPWDEEINRTDLSDLAKEENDKVNRLNDVLPDQQPIPI